MPKEPTVGHHLDAYLKVVDFDIARRQRWWMKTCIII